MCALLSCAPYNGTNEDQQLAVINVLLVAGTPRQSLTVRWAGTPNDVNPGAGPAASDVRLWITSSAGDSVAVTPTDTAAHYAIALTPVSGVTYHLGGTILRTRIDGITTVPSLAITAPKPGDTLHASVLVRDQSDLVAISPTLVGSAVGGYGVSGAVIEGQNGILSNLKDSFSEGPLNVIYRGPDPLPVHAEITAYDSNAARFYGVIQAEQPVGPIADGRILSTVTGALGLFGSRAAPVSLDVVIVP
jgi:hypothetical protein